MSLATNFQNILEVINRKIGFKLDKSEANETYASKTDLKKTDNKVNGVSKTVGKMSGRLLPDTQYYDVEDGYVVTWQKDGWYPKYNPGKKVAIALEQNGSTFTWGPVDSTITIADITTLLNNGKQVIFSIGDEECNITSWTWGEITACSFSISRDSWTNTTQCIYYYVKAQRDYSNDQDTWTVIQYTPNMIPNTGFDSFGKTIRSQGGSGNGGWYTVEFPLVIRLHEEGGVISEGAGYKGNTIFHDWNSIRNAVHDGIPVVVDLSDTYTDSLLVQMNSFTDDSSDSKYSISGTTYDGDDIYMVKITWDGQDYTTSGMTYEIKTGSISVTWDT